jgi:hypothetical protein
MIKLLSFAYYTYVNLVIDVFIKLLRRTKIFIKIK